MLMCHVSGMEVGRLAGQPRTFPWFQLLCSRFLLLCPAPPDGLGNALATFRSKIPLLLSPLDGFLGGWGGRSLFSRRGGFAAQYGTCMLQLGDLTINLCKNF